jgi:curli production assembly/transport component CsgG
MRLADLRLGLMMAGLAGMLAACDATQTPPFITAPPTSAETTATYRALKELPPPSKKVVVAVYNYPDLTGQFKPTETVSTNSRAVTQGAVWMLVKALKDASGGQWFKVIQRANLDNLLKERQIIRETRTNYAKNTGAAQPGLPSLLFAGVILEGGIIGYDSNTVTGGIGARYLGIGADSQYRQDTVTVYLNAISSQTGEILKSVMTRKTVASYGVRGSVFKFVAFQKLLEGEAGYTVNEPGQIALTQAIEHVVRAMVIEGARDGLWRFENAALGREQMLAYYAEKDEEIRLDPRGNPVAAAPRKARQVAAAPKASTGVPGRTPARLAATSTVRAPAAQAGRDTLRRRAPGSGTFVAASLARAELEPSAVVPTSASPRATARAAVPAAYRAAPPKATQLVAPARPRPDREPTTSAPASIASQEAERALEELVRVKEAVSVPTRSLRGSSVTAPLPLRDRPIPPDPNLIPIDAPSEPGRPLMQPL